LALEGKHTQNAFGLYIADPYHGLHRKAPADHEEEVGHGSGEEHEKKSIAVRLQNITSVVPGPQATTPERNRVVTMASTMWLGRLVGRERVLDSNVSRFYRLVAA